MLYKMITVSEKEVGRIAGNAGAHAEMMARDLTDRWRAKLGEGQEVIDILQLQLCVRDDLRDMRREIAEIERFHLSRLADDRESREVRDVSVPQLRERLIGIQRLMDGTYGAGTSTKVFGESTLVIPLDPFPLRRLGHMAHGRLMDPELELPKPRLAGVRITPTGLASSFEEPLAKLDEVLVGLEDSQPASNASLELKVKKLDDLQKQAGIAARFLEALYHLAGHDVIARKVRLSSHRRRANDEVENGEPAGGEPTGDEPAVIDTTGDPLATDEAALPEGVLPFSTQVAASAPPADREGEDEGPIAA